jgi:GNAT superfamily N-acetyltransferase
MSLSLTALAHLEQINYALAQPLADHIPGMYQIRRPDLILTGSRMFPAPDTTHACALQATPATADSLIDEIVAHFQAEALPVAIFLSPTCTPADLSTRLEKRGFIAQPNAEAWLIYDNLQTADLPPQRQNVTVRAITAAEASTFAHTFLAAFELPTLATPTLTELIAPSLAVAGSQHYLAWVGDKPVGTASLIHDGEHSILGSVGVLPAHRRGAVGPALVIHAGQAAQQVGVQTIITQAVANSRVERLLRLGRFRKIFTRTCYLLP